MATKESPMRDSPNKESPKKDSSNKDYSNKDTKAFNDSKESKEAPAFGGDDAELKRFAAAVERSLLSFDAVSEWADVIGFLSRLAKIFQTFPQFQTVPKKLVVSKRLAQCLNPALPAGVHTKALEVYALIFQAASRAQLAEDLPLWSYGLFPFSAHAAMSVKPLLISLYERFYVPLGVRLRPSLKGLILAILPMLEEEGNEFFEKAMSILDQISECAETVFFFRALWLAAISSPHHRQATVHYLLRKLPRMTGPEDMAVVLGNRPDLLAQALSTLLSDKIALVQRGALELLVTQFPLSTSVFSEDDLDLVLTAAVAVVLRRDMSLNRRLYSWILDLPTNESQKSSTSSKSRSFGLKKLCRTLKAMLHAPQQQHLPITELSRPYKIMISLLDKPELGPPAVEAVFTDILQSLSDTCAQSVERGQELLSGAAMLMDSLDPFFIWKQFHTLVTSHAHNTPQRLNNLHLVLFALNRFSFVDDETQRVHIPFLYHVAASQLTQFTSRHITELDSGDVATAVLCTKLVDLLSADVFLNTWILRDFRGTSNEKRDSLATIQDPSPVSVTSPLLLSPVMSLANAELTGAQSSSPSPSSLSVHPVVSPLATAPAAANDVGQHQVGESAPGTPEHGISPTTSVVDACSTTDIASVYNASDTSAPNFRTWLDSIVVGRPSVEVALSCIRRFGNVLVGEIPSLIGSSSTSIQSARHTQPRATLTVAESHHDDGNVTAVESRQQHLLNMWRCLAHILSRHVQVGASFDAFTVDWISSYIRGSIRSDVFEVAHLGVSTALDILTAQTASKVTAPQLWLRSHALPVVAKFWSLLSTEHIGLHEAASKLIVNLVSLIGLRSVEDCVMSLILSAGLHGRCDALYRFGILWRHFEDTGHDTSLMLSRPLFFVFDAMTSPNLALQSSGQTWLRSFVRSYARVVPPLFAIMTHTDIRFSDASMECTGSDRVTRYRFLSRFNYAQVVHAMATFEQLIDYGGSGFTRSMWNSTALRHEWVSAACAWASDAISSTTTTTSSATSTTTSTQKLSFADALILICLRFAIADPADDDHINATDIASCNAVQHAACRLLLNFIARATPLPSPLVSFVHSRVISRLRVCVMIGSVDLQPVLLSMLSLPALLSPYNRFGESGGIATSTQATASTLFRSVSKDHAVPGSNTTARMSSSFSPPYPIIQLFLVCLTRIESRSVLPNWLDLVCATVSRLRPLSLDIVMPVIAALCGELGRCRDRVCQMVSRGDRSGDHRHHRRCSDSGNGLSTSRYNTTSSSSSKPSLAIPTSSIHDTTPHAKSSVEMDILVTLSSLEKIIMFFVHDIKVHCGVVSTGVYHDVSASAAPTLLSASSLPSLSGASGDQVGTMMALSAGMIGATFLSDVAVPVNASVSEPGSKPNTTSSASSASVIGNHSGGGTGVSSIGDILAIFPGIVHVLCKLMDVVDDTGDDVDTGVVRVSPSNLPVNTHGYPTVCVTTESDTHGVSINDNDTMRDTSKTRHGCLHGMGSTRYPLTGVSSRVRLRLRRVIESMHKFSSVAVIESIVEVWLRDNETVLEPNVFVNDNDDGDGMLLRRCALKLLPLIPECTHKVVVVMLCEGLRQRLPYLQGGATTSTVFTVSSAPSTSTSGSSTSTTRDGMRVGSRGGIPDTSLLMFLDYYIRYETTAETIPHVFPHVLSFLKEACVQGVQIKYMFGGLLRVVCGVMDKGVMTTGAVTGAGHGGEDKRTRRDMEEIFQRVADHCIMLIARGIDQGAWRRINSTDGYDSIYRDVGVDVSVSPHVVDEALGFVAPSRRLGRPVEDVLIHATMTYMATMVIPSLRRYVQDHDRITSLVNNFVYYIAAPMLRARLTIGKLLVHPVLDCICAVLTIPSALKSLRKDIWDVFMDPRFFDTLDMKSVDAWLKLVHTVAHHDKERVIDVMTRISATSTTSLFVSRDQECATRVHMLHRLSFMMYGGDCDAYLPHLPSIQEKIVEAFKSVSESFLVEAFLCLRVILCRFGARHVSNLWPIVVSELIRVFSLFIRPNGNSAGGGDTKTDTLNVLFSALQLVDVVLVLGVEDFQWYRWVFVSEMRDGCDGDGDASLMRSGGSLFDRLEHRLSLRCVPDTNSSVSESSSTVDLGVSATDTLTIRRRGVPAASLTRHDHHHHRGVKTAADVLTYLRDIHTRSQIPSVTASHIPMEIETALRKAFVHGGGGSDGQTDPITNAVS